MSRRPIEHPRDLSPCLKGGAAHKWVKSFFQSYCSVCGKKRAIR